MKYRQLNSTPSNISSIEVFAGHLKKYSNKNLGYLLVFCYRCTVVVPHFMRVDSKIISVIQ